MFEKLLALLPYNPGLAHQLSFYARRMHEEAAIRRIGVVFMVLTFMVQFFAVLSPPEPTFAASYNSLIPGGFNSAAEAKQICLADRYDYQKIVKHYGLRCGDIGNAPTVSLKSDAHSGRIFSVGRLPKGAHNPTTGRATEEKGVNIPGADKFYWRRLDSWGTTSYKALKLTSAVTGKTFWIIYDCGNLATLEVPSPAPTPTPAPTPAPPVTPVLTATPTPPSSPPPPPTPPTPPPTPPIPPPVPPETPKCDVASCITNRKTATNVTAGLADANNTTANPGDVITYTLYAQNTGQAAVKQFAFQENIRDVLDYADATDLHGGNMDANRVVTWPAVDIAVGQTATVQVTIKVKDPVPQTPADPGDPDGFDLIMTNVYGNAINIHVPGSPGKTVQAAATTLPNTGPGTSLMIAAAVVIMAAYFYARARLLSKESVLAIQENAGV
jgi:uncharacterized repeat protein (TIGR01451 family)